MRQIKVNRCRELRRNQTDAERSLWAILRNRQLSGVKFRRQFAIDKYILDFYSPKYKLGIEADGGQHYEVKGERSDKSRTEKLSKLGVKLLRFSNLEILKNTEGIYEAIQEAIEDNQR